MADGGIEPPLVYSGYKPVATSHSRAAGRRQGRPLGAAAASTTRVQAKQIPFHVSNREKSADLAPVAATAVNLVDIQLQMSAT